MQLVRDIGTLAGRIPLDGVHVPGIDDVRDALVGALRDVATALRTGGNPPSLDHLPDCLGPAHAAIDSMTSAHDAPRGLVGTVDMLDTIADAIQRLAGEVGDWERVRTERAGGWWHRLTPAPAAAAAARGT
jgi:hypothetical protein